MKFLLSLYFFFLGFFHLKFHSSFLVKVGTSHFFSPNVVTVLSYFIPILDIITAVLLLLNGFRKISAMLAIVLSIAYLLYALFIFWGPNVSCNCSNIFWNINPKLQMMYFSISMVLSIFFLIHKQKDNTNESSIF
ncbi:MAG: hypothetical protein B6D37_09280 [Sphingobacteriales bacterium UTBCD1]|jgi:predicted Co/Zn/Cd cation transporter (cation efflux family)|nr:MAG: hypothetical protein B6D37_09280 [Sphingobacteriales bacterium UTBCD1]